MTTVPAEVLDAAVKLVNALAANDTFRTQLAEEEIQRRIDAGELIPVARLSLAPGLELVPAGRLPELEAAARRVVDAWLNIPGEQGWTDEEVVLSRAVKGLAALFDLEPWLHDSTTGDSAAAVAVAVTPRRRRRLRRGAPKRTVPVEAPSIDEPAPVEAPAPDDDVSGSATLQEAQETGNGAEAETPGKPPEMPERGHRGPCEQCGATIEEEEQAQLSWIIHRRVLCRTCHIGPDAPPPEAEEPPDEEETQPDADAGDS